MIVIDPGHGGSDSGAVGSGLQEKDITLSLSKKIGKILELHGLEVFYTRTTDKFVSLADRAKIARDKKAKVFVSVHVNSAANTAATGLEVWTSKGQDQGDVLATHIGQQLQKDFPSIAFRTDYSDGDLDKEANFAVLLNKGIPSCLVEYLFIVNPRDAQILKTKQDDLAKSTAKGILSYLGKEHFDMEETRVIVNGKECKAYIINGQTFVEVRKPFEEAGFTVNYNPKTKLVEIAK